MKKIFNISLFLLFFLLTASCTDEELIQTSGYRDGEAVTLSFNISVPAETEVAVTRATDSENKVEDLTLLVFSGEGENATLEQVCTSYDNAGKEFNKGTMTDVDDTHKKFTVTLEAANASKAIYILANAGSLLFGDASSIAIGSTTLDDLRQIETSITSSSYFIMSGCKVLPIPHADLMTQDFPIYRSHAKVTVDVAESLQGKFTLQGFYLCNAQQDASVVAYPLYEPPSSSILPEATDDPKEENMVYSTWLNWDNVLKTDAQYPAPTQNAAVANNRNTQVFLLVKGEYTEEGQSPVTYYYHADFKTDDGPLDVRPNHHYKVTITDVDRIGYRHSLEGLKGAIAGAENATVNIEDINPDSRNMASDGVTEIGVESDTLKITGKEKGAKVEFKVTVSPSILTEGNRDTINIDWDKEQAPWLTLEAIDPDTQTTEYESGNGQTYSVTTCTLKTQLPNNSGERREARVGISCRGVLTYVTVIQQPDFCADQFGTVSLTVKEYERDEDWEVTNETVIDTYDNYWDFIRGKDTDNPLYGISAEAMGGKVRTEGFHAPMSDYQQFVYTFTLPDGGEYAGCSWQVEVDEDYADKLLFWNGSESTPGGGSTSLRPSGSDMSGQTFTFTNNLLDLQNGGDITKDAYRYGEKAFRIVVTRPDGAVETYAYDLYHTGVFNYDDGSNAYQAGTQTDKGWYYYEVILMGRNYWLDRNLGAKSSAYYSKAMGGSDDEWPYRGDAAGGLYRIANAPGRDGEVNIISDKELERIAPRGFRVPYMSEFQALTADSRFRQEFVYGTGSGYWDARYETGRPDQGTVYFPKNGLWYGGAAAGTGDTGYYWTQTAALGASGTERGYWLQDMQLSGSNASAGRYRIYQEGEQNPTGMSVRCVYNSRVVETSHRYECYVKGYTHVFLYYENGEGDRTYLNTWPGEMISIYDPDALSMYHTFAYESVTDYGELKVVFNRVDNDREVIETYPADYATRGGLTLKEEGEQTDKFFHRGGTDWTHSAE
ncbi:MAG TPA: hypothetical protein H9819_02350 [Candidatus Bacteroides merdipullorum]|uniref:Major fimbrial subunit protein N-terminal domain-containing protein n=1 Tax=Candidatus Bacteroides merdipullorum TaxID=2838474 RepID=A0A9D2A2J6_9BACE|nr:hypothetical protein [Candidatus Bacteroides merdipullorum]